MLSRETSKDLRLMTISFFCDCGKRLEVGEVLKGELIHCPECQAPITVPALSETAGIQRDGSNASQDDDSLKPDSHVVTKQTRRRPTSKPSGKAIVSLTFGLLSFCANFVTAVPALILGLISLRDIRRSNGRLTGKGLAVGGIIASLIGIPFSTAVYFGGFTLLFKVRESLYETSALTESRKDLEVIGQGLMYYSDNLGGLPPASFNTPSARTNPKAATSGLSWRVAVLPFIGEEDLYREFDLDQPWDSPNNLKLVPNMPKIYAHPLASEKQKQNGFTHYRVFVGQGTVFDPSLVRGAERGVRIVGTRLADIADGRGNTLMIAEAAEPVEWTRPDDLPFISNKPLPKLGGLFSMGFNIVTADGKVHLVRQDAKESVLRSLITRNGGEAIDWNDLE
jgi:hypothetical protein